MNPLLTVVCANCGKQTPAKHEDKKFCDSRCRSAYKRKHPVAPPPFVGSYDLLPDNLKRLFTPGDPEKCWIATKRSPNGYAQNTSVNGYKAQAYRLVYMMMVGPIPEGLDLDHTCDNGQGGCINWHHLTPATRRENVNRTTRTIPGRHILKTHCPQGHPYDEENTMIQTYRGTVERHCRICVRERNKRLREANRDRYRANQRKYEQSEQGKAKRRERQRRARERKRQEREPS